ncbi:aminotransferase class V-fold PLP-dependent enzyme [Balneolaceae bacterium YR4-1]|uniref:Aminotransferase class V-fold PLP-dependent enzyme n=1 Tax=Halalkalibaculum roseum TaxID=2709311 RepID=A0A6M1SJL3_9BACT|nr:aminotransferase class V-fold PLP-dependent enzyme [Halalkalibaculum roseum]NGP75491.1 aminotransferase class V-fold PLP-dependent enzyme [Halalkalibaculum roseum]
MDCQKHLFSLPEDHHYLNCAYFSPILKSVEEAGKRGIEQKRTPWKVSPEHFFKDSDRLRSLFAQLVNAPKANRVAILPSASYGLSTVAKNLPRDTSKKIIVVGEQFPSNVYPWMRYCDETDAQLEIIKAPDKPKGRGKRWNEHILDAIDKNTLMVAIGNVHWTDGTLFDLISIGKKCREIGAFLVIDGTQSVGALPFDIQEIRPDALICAGYKWLMGPYSIALGYFGPRFREGIPLEEGWLDRKGSEDFAGLVNYVDEYQPGSIRFDVGERSNFILVPMMIKALEQLLEWEPKNIQNYCKDLTQQLVEELPQLGFQIEDTEWRSHHLFGIRLPEHISAKELQQNLTDHNIHVSVRGSAIRIAPNVYNEEEDIEALKNILKSSGSTS